MVVIWLSTQFIFVLSPHKTLKYKFLYMCVYADRCTRILFSMNSSHTYEEEKQTKWYVTDGIQSKREFCSISIISKH